MKVRLLAIVCAGAWLAQAAGILAQQFDAPPTASPGPASDTTQSLGTFSMILNPAFSGAFVGMTGYTASTNIFTSPLLYDPTTQINRSSGSLTLGNGASVSAPVGSPGGFLVTSNSGDTALTFSGNMGVTAGLSYPIPTGTGATAPSTNAVFTQIKAFNLAGFISGGIAPGATSVTVGTAAMDPNLPASVGQVTSNSTTGGFPARSFFDVFVDIEVPLPPAIASMVGSSTAELTNATVFNSSSAAITPPGMPLVIANTGITAFPPVVIYTHGNSTAVPIYVESGLGAGILVGQLILAGHGAGYGSSAGTGNSNVDENTGQPADQTTFMQTYQQMLTTPGDTMPVLPQYASWVTPYSNVEVMPEPSSIGLLVALSGGVAAVWYRRRRARRSGKFSATATD